MGIFDEINGVLQQYENNSGAMPPERVNEHYQKASDSAPQHVASAISDSLKSNQTPPLEDSISTLFKNSNSQQKAGFLNTLLASGAGSLLLGKVLGQHGNNVTPEQADLVHPDTVKQIVAGSKGNPSLIDKMSEFYSQHPQVVKSLGAAFLTMVLSKMSSHASAER